LRRHALPERLQRAYPKRLRFELFTVGARVTTHAGQPTAELSLGEAATAEILAIRRKLLTIYEAHGNAAS
jgi:hypothetical protein